MSSRRGAGTKNTCEGGLYFLTKEERILNLGSIQTDANEKMTH